MKGFHLGLRRLCSILLGLVFFIAGMLKLMDPVGAGLVVEEYFEFFHLGWLAFASKWLAVILMAPFSSLRYAVLPYLVLLLSGH